MPVWDAVTRCGKWDRTLQFGKYELACMEIPGLRHSARLSLIGGETSWLLSGQGLVFENDQGSEVIPYADIRSLRLITYAGAGGTQARTTVTAAGHGKLKIGSHHYVSLGNFEDRSVTYTPFIRELAQRVTDANPRALFIAGSFGLWLGWVIVCFLVLALAVLLVIAVLEDAPPLFGLVGAVVLVVTAGPLAMRWALRNLPKPFDPKSVPDDLLLADRN